METHLSSLCSDCATFFSAKEADKNSSRETNVALLTGMKDACNVCNIIQSHWPLNKIRSYLPNLADSAYSNILVNVKRRRPPSGEFPDKTIIPFAVELSITTAECSVRSTQFLQIKEGLSADQTQQHLSPIPPLPSPDTTISGLTLGVLISFVEELPGDSLALFNVEDIDTLGPQNPAIAGTCTAQFDENDYSREFAMELTCVLVHHEQQNEPKPRYKETFIIMELEGHTQGKGWMYRRIGVGWFDDGVRRFGDEQLLHVL